MSIRTMQHCVSCETVNALNVQVPALIGVLRDEEVVGPFVSVTIMCYLCERCKSDLGDEPVVGYDEMSCITSIIERCDSYNDVSDDGYDQYFAMSEPPE